MKEEDYLIERVGKENPFRVPEGYFDTLASQVMARVDAEPAVVRPVRKAKSVWLRPVFYAAASVCALFVCATVWLSQGTSETTASSQLSTVSSPLSSPDAFDEAADYVMIDNQDIYACLSADY